MRTQKQCLDIMETVMTCEAPIKEPPSCDNEVCVGCAPKGAMQLWVMEYEVNGVGKGCAMAKAINAKEAVNILKSSGLYNGAPSLYNVTRVEQIIVPPCNGLMAEQVVAFNQQ